MSRKTRILLADDHAIVRQGFKLILNQEPDLEVVGEASDGVEAVRLTQQLRPDIVIMDIGMPNRNGIAGTQAAWAEAFDNEYDPAGQISVEMNG